MIEILYIVRTLCSYFEQSIDNSNSYFVLKSFFILSPTIVILIGLYFNDVMSILIYPILYVFGYYFHFMISRGNSKEIKRESWRFAWRACNIYLIIGGVVHIERVLSGFQLPLVGNENTFIDQSIYNYKLYLFGHSGEISTLTTYPGYSKFT